MNALQKLDFRTFLIYSARLKATRGEVTQLFNTPQEVDNFGLTQQITSPFILVTWLTSSVFAVDFYLFFLLHPNMNQSFFPV